MSEISKIDLIRTREHLKFGVLRFEDPKKKKKRGKELECKLERFRGVEDISNGKI